MGEGVFVRMLLFFVYTCESGRRLAVFGFRLTTPTDCRTSVGCTHIRAGMAAGCGM